MLIRVNRNFSDTRNPSEFYTSIYIHLKAEELTDYAKNIQIRYDDLIKNERFVAEPNILTITSQHQIFNCYDHIQNTINDAPLMRLMYRNEAEEPSTIEKLTNHYFSILPCYRCRRWLLYFYNPSTNYYYLSCTKEFNDKDLRRAIDTFLDMSTGPPVQLIEVIDTKSGIRYDDEWKHYYFYHQFLMRKYWNKWLKRTKQKKLNRAIYECCVHELNLKYRVPIFY